MILREKCTYSAPQPTSAVCATTALPSHQAPDGAGYEGSTRPHAVKVAFLRCLGDSLRRARSIFRLARRTVTETTRTLRYEVQMPMLFRRYKGILWYDGRIENINFQGAFLHGEKALEVGSLIEVSFWLPNPGDPSSGTNVFFWAKVVRTCALGEGSTPRGLGVEILRYRTAPNTAADLRWMTGEVRGPFGTGHERRPPRPPLQISPWDFPPPAEEPLNLWELLYAPLVQPARRSVGTGGWAVFFGAARA